MFLKKICAHQFDQNTVKLLWTYITKIIIFFLNI